MFCTNCGSKIELNSKFCANCGVQVECEDINKNEWASHKKYEVLDALYHKEIVAFYIWIGVVCYQLLVGFILPSAWGFAIWNSFACYQTYKFKDKIKKYPVGLYKHYKESLTTSIIFLILNLILAGVIGAIGAIYDLYVRQYAMENGDILLDIERDALNKK